MIREMELLTRTRPFLYIGSQSKTRTLPNVSDEYILVKRLFYVKDFGDFESHGLARPLRGYFTKPTIYD